MRLSDSSLIKLRSEYPSTRFAGLADFESAHPPPDPSSCGGQYDSVADETKLSDLVVPNTAPNIEREWNRRFLTSEENDAEEHDEE